MKLGQEVDRPRAGEVGQAGALGEPLPDPLVGRHGEPEVDAEPGHGRLRPPGREEHLADDA
eukprot:4714642-Lingulodinium_polyedra.AAC.1